MANRVIVAGLQQSGKTSVIRDLSGSDEDTLCLDTKYFSAELELEELLLDDNDRNDFCASRTESLAGISKKAPGALILVTRALATRFAETTRLAGTLLVSLEPQHRFLVFNETAKSEALGSNRRKKLVESASVISWCLDNHFELIYRKYSEAMPPLTNFDREAALRKSLLDPDELEGIPRLFQALATCPGWQPGRSEKALKGYLPLVQASDSLPGNTVILLHSAEEGIPSDVLDALGAQDYKLKIDTKYYSANITFLPECVGDRDQASWTGMQAVFAVFRKPKSYQELKAHLATVPGVSNMEVVVLLGAGETAMPVSRVLERDIPEGMELVLVEDLKNGNGHSSGSGNESQPRLPEALAERFNEDVNSIKYVLETLRSVQWKHMCLRGPEKLLTPVTRSGCFQEKATRQCDSSPHGLPTDDSTGPARNSVAIVYCETEQYPADVLAGLGVQEDGVLTLTTSRYETNVNISTTTAQAWVHSSLDVKASLPHAAVGIFRSLTAMQSLTNCLPDEPDIKVLLGVGTFTESEGESVWQWARDHGYEVIIIKDLSQTSSASPKTAPKKLAERVDEDMDSLDRLREALETTIWPAATLPKPEDVKHSANYCDQAAAVGDRRHDEKEAATTTGDIFEMRWKNRWASGAGKYGCEIPAGWILDSFSKKSRRIEPCERPEDDPCDVASSDEDDVIDRDMQSYDRLMQEAMFLRHQGGNLDPDERHERAASVATRLFGDLQKHGG
ncbi:hypothetical protein DIPPA_70182 [Diplonema papillatum]|nr:hypothetical protein DIPPA_70182 [Diplonema papillatum]